MEVPIYVANMLGHDPDAYLRYCTDVKGLKNVRILRPCIKKNSLIIVDGYPMRIRGVDSKNVIWKNGIQPVFVKQERLIRNIEKYLDKNQDYDVSERFDKMTDDELIELYDDVVTKLLITYAKRPSNQGKLMKEDRENFAALTLKEKAILLNSALNMLRCDIETKADLSAVGGSKNAGAMAVNKNTVGKNKLILVNQSVTGLYENRVEL